MSACFAIGGYWRYQLEGYIEAARRTVVSPPIVASCPRILTPQGDDCTTKGVELFGVGRMPKFG